MGKRELLLIVAFVIVGAVVYQATAPPAGPNERSFSLSRILDHVRREMRGNRASAQDTRSFAHELEASVTEVRIAGSLGELTITGENRSSLEGLHRVSSTGYDDAEARELVKQTMSMLKLDRAGSSLRLSVEYPRPGSQRAQLTLRVPRRITVRIDGGASRTTVSGLAGLEFSGRGETTVKHITGRATVTHRAGRVVIEDVGALKMSGRSSDVRVTNVRGDVSLSMQSGEVEASAVGGPIDVDAQNTDVSFTDLERAHKPIRVNAVGGSVKLDGVSADARIDGRNTGIDVAMAKPAAVAIYNEGDEPLAITLPPGGVAIDALVTHGRVTLPKGLGQDVMVTGGDGSKEQRAAGAVRGGGPTITLRANRGEIRIRLRETTAPDVER